LTKLDTANAELHRAVTALHKGKAAAGASLVNDVDAVLGRLQPRVNALRATPRYRKLPHRLQISLARSFTAVRKLRLTVIDLTGKNRTDANAEFKDARVVLRRAERSVQALARALNR
jgi:cob(I)alamin adenosyltransferase